MAALLEVESLHKTYPDATRRVEVLKGADLSVEPGEFISIEGPSGSGKTTLLLILGGLLQPTRGTVCIDEEDVYRLTVDRRARFRAGHIGFVFQEFHLLPYLTVLENVLAASLARRTDNVRDRAHELLSRLGLSDRMDHKPRSLSTGERQRTAFARAMLNQPRLILADEPTGNLDQANSAMALGCLADFAGEGGSVILATHDPLAAEHAHRVLNLADGKLHQSQA